MEWKEFTQYIIDSVLADKGSKNIFAIGDTKVTVTETDILDQAYARRSKRYQIANVQDTS